MQTKWTKPHQGKSTTSYLMEEAEVITIETFLQRYVPQALLEAETPDGAIECFDESVDIFVQPVTLGNPKSRDAKQFVLDGKGAFKRFRVEDYRELVERVLTDEGFIASQRLHILARPTSLEQVVAEINTGKKSGK